MHICFVFIKNAARCMFRVHPPFYNVILAFATSYSSNLLSIKTDCGCYVSTNKEQNTSRDMRLPCWRTKPDVMRPVSACHDLYWLSVKRESQDNIPQIIYSDSFIVTDGP